MDIPELARKLAEGQTRLTSVLNSDVSDQDRLGAFAMVAEAQRALAAAKGEEYATPYDIGFEPEAAVSGAILLQTEYAAFLIFNAMQPRGNGTRTDAGLGVVETRRCSLTKFGYPNDEAPPGHPLAEKGLHEYGVFEVMNSRWIRQLTEHNRVQFPDTVDSSERHFIFTFHDSTLECIVESLEAWRSDRPFAEVFEDIRARAFR